jgi:hypothetical protein
VRLVVLDQREIRVVMLELVGLLVVQEVQEVRRVLEVKQMLGDSSV